MFKTVKATLARHARRLLRAGATRRFVRHQDASAAVEFGLVAAPFFAMVFAIMETAFVFFAGQSLEYAAAQSGRLIMTGQADAAGYELAVAKRRRRGIGREALEDRLGS